MSRDATPPVRVSVRAKPRAKKSRIVRADGLAVEVSLAAPPVDGAANAELLVVVAGALGIPRKDLRLALGAGSKIKVLEVQGLAADEVERRLAASVGR
jgi:uncharacterized protein YggU (UPF0235/DUF167 family)